MTKIIALFVLITLSSPGQSAAFSSNSGTIPGMVESFLAETSPPRRTILLQDLHHVLTQYHREYLARAVHGGQMLDAEIADPELIKRVYRSNDAQLIKLFRQLAPVPPSRLFLDGDVVPASIADEMACAKIAIAKFCARFPVGTTEEQLTRHVTEIQRGFRGRLRQKEHVANVRSILSTLRNDGYVAHEMSEADIVSHMTTPYDFAGCPDPELRLRLLRARKLVTLHHEIKHWAAPEALASILDDGLFGRRNLRETYRCFSPAALCISDISLGDGNAICFGPDKIDPIALKPRTVEIILDFDELRRRPEERDNPCMFYKSRDLNFDIFDARTISLGRDSYDLCHTRPLPDGSSSHTYLLSSSSQSDEKPAVGEMLKCLNIFSNVDGFDEILVSNIFRYIDNPRSGSKSLAGIYDTLRRITDENDLVSALTLLGRTLTDTAEVNWFGSFVIPMDLIKSFRVIDEQQEELFRLDLKDLIEELGRGEQTLQSAIRVHLPELETSERWIKYLRSQTI